jgi:hypothetical protein
MKRHVKIVVKVCAVHRMEVLLLVLLLTLIVILADVSWFNKSSSIVHWNLRKWNLRTFLSDAAVRNNLTLVNNLRLIEMKILTMSGSVWNFSYDVQRFPAASVSNFVTEKLKILGFCWQEGTFFVFTAFSYYSCFWRNTVWQTDGRLTIIKRDHKLKNSLKSLWFLLRSCIGHLVAPEQQSNIPVFGHRARSLGGLQ